jgi:D-alanyl-lipoteichoic acid acyltransferase DltB (MBOAT superfamily)
MDFRQILFFILAALIIRYFPVLNIRKWLLLVTSIGFLYWLQPLSPIRYMDFYLPTILLLLTLLSWFVITPPDNRYHKENLMALAIAIVSILLINATRWFGLTGIITASRPPTLSFLLISVIGLGLVFWLLRNREAKSNHWLGIVFLIVFIILLLILKNPTLNQWAAKQVGVLQKQSLPANIRFDIRWLGISYVIFRLLHTIKDYQSNRLSGIKLVDYLNYVIFFPTLSAGPIDRIQHFSEELNLDKSLPDRNHLVNAGWRIILGLFKKFAIADTLAIIALHNLSLSQIQNSGWVIVSIYAYTIMIFLDFDAYTDIALGLGHVFCIKLPENFNKPYLRPNIKLFWDNWHITLTQWFRTYYFNPVSRSLRRKWKNVPVGVLVFFMQMTTMLLIGLWHGATWNFAIWGLWHGVGLFLHNRWSAWLEQKQNFSPSPIWETAKLVGGVFITFHFVAFGWVWFALPSMDQSLQVFGLLFGGAHG